MVRHGRAAAGFDVADPGLDELGRSQAADVAKLLQPIGPLNILSSPLARTRETALPLASLWKRAATIEAAVAEIPSPPGLSLTARVPWLRQFMAGSWSNAEPDLEQWRQSVVAALLAQAEDVVVFSHFIAINVALGSAVDDPRVVIFAPDNCSVTIFESDGTRLRLVERGREAATKVN
jgi:broad specificity phosphatase PhoE